MMQRILLAIAFTLGLALPADRPAAEAPTEAVDAVMTLYSPHDIWDVYVSAWSARISLRDLDQYDTTNTQTRSPVVIITPTDTLVITPQDEPFNLMLVSPTDTVFETILFPPSQEALLATYALFGTTPAPPGARFTYADASAPDLVRLREEFELDSIAGNGPETEQILNLLEWAHTVVRHDGSSENPEPSNALNIVRVCREQNRGVNCRMLATILNEAYLALGFRSRHITCLPFDPNDPDCHVTNMVYLKSLTKWVYVDPSFGAYFSAEDGTLLGFPEIRARLADGRPLLLPDGMDWNGKPKPDDEYRRYMIKNMFRFSSPIASEPGYESSDGDRTWVALSPVGFEPDSVGTADTAGTPGSLRITYRTDNADFFWSEPE